ncbi:glycosyltransferase family 4 protein [Snuella lapsa]|uniref:Colanic acid biosynthesis glycosyltransferase WcaL n=1 Tax=Snuella lapsa TaxID=870481 RepID=A0ABP6XS46_9FLAO
MKIGLVLAAPPGYSETFFMSKIKGLQAQGMEVVLFSQTKSSTFTLCATKVAYPFVKSNLLKQLFWGGVVCFRLLWHFKRVVKFISLEQRAKRSLPAIIKNLYASAHILTVTLDWLHFGFATMALGKEHVAKSIGAKMAVSLRGFDIAIYPIKHEGCYKHLWLQVDKLHTISNDLYDLAVRNGLSKTIPYQKITPAIDVRLFKAGEKYFSESGTDLTLLTVARLHWKKGLLETLKALTLLKAQGVAFTYTIVGAGPLKEELVYTIHLLGLNDHVVLAGVKSPESVKDMLEKHEVYIQYSISEGFCNALLEAQAMGLLCVASDAEGLPENVKHETSGWIVPKSAPEALATQLLKVSTLPLEEKQRISRQAVNRVRKLFDIEQQKQAFEEFYLNYPN